MVGLFINQLGAFSPPFSCYFSVFFSFGNELIWWIMTYNQLLWWSDPSHQPNSHPAAHSVTSPKAWGENRRLMSWYDGSLIRKAKAALASKAERGIRSVLPIGRQKGGHSLGSRAPAHVTAIWADKCPNHEHLPFLFLFLNFYCQARRHMVWISLWSGSAALTVSPPSVLPTTSFDAVQTLLAKSQNIGV